MPCVETPRSAQSPPRPRRERFNRRGFRVFTPACVCDSLSRLIYHHPYSPTTHCFCGARRTITPRSSKIRRSARSPCSDLSDIDLHANRSVVASVVVSWKWWRAVSSGGSRKAIKIHRRPEMRESQGRFIYTVTHRRSLVNGRFRASQTEAS